LLSPHESAHPTSQSDEGLKGSSLLRLYHPRVAKSAAILADTTGQPLRAPAYVESLPEYFTSKIPIDLTVGSSSDWSEIYVGGFRELMIRLRTSFRLEVTRTAGDAFGNLQVWIRAYLRADVQLMTDAQAAGVTPM
jgi:HK97 family phage major capsid protein